MLRSCLNARPCRPQMLGVSAARQASLGGRRQIDVLVPLPRIGVVGRLSELRYLSDKPGRIVQSDDTVVSQPPAIVRASLVGAATALMTPLFPVIGFNQIVFRFVDPATRMVLTGGSSMLMFSAMTLVPNAFFYAPLLLPFAIGNGVTAMGLYAAVETLAGGPDKLAAAKLWGFIPVVGPVLGVATALIAPFAYPACFALTFPEESNALDVTTYCNIFSFCFGSEFGWIVTPCLATTGFTAGMLIHIFTKPVIVGIPGVPWQQLAGGVLAATSIALAALYSTSVRSSTVEHLHDVDVNAQELQGWFFRRRAPCYIRGEQELFWVPTLDTRTGDVHSERLRLQVLADGHYQYHKDGVRERGGQRAAHARKLFKKAQDKRVKCYASSRSAYFDGFPLNYDPLDGADIRRKMEALPKQLKTDLLTLVVVGAVPQQKLEESLHQLQQEYGDQILPKLSGQFLADISLHAAQLRELHRLEDGAALGPMSSRELQESLYAAGFEVSRLMDSLRTMSWRPSDSTAHRMQDWTAIQNALKHEKKQTLIREALAIGFVAGTSLLLYKAMPA